MDATRERNDWAVWVPADDGVLPVEGGSYTKVRWDRGPVFKRRQDALDEAIRSGTIRSGPLRGLAPVVRSPDAAPSNTYN